MNKIFISVLTWLLDRLYDYIDKNDDGKISKNELIEIYDEVLVRFEDILSKFDEKFNR